MILVCLEISFESAKFLIKFVMISAFTELEIMLPGKSNKAYVLNLL